MPTVSDVHVDQPLTDFSVDWMEGEGRRYAATAVTPIILTDKKSGKYYEWSREDLLRDEAQRRAPSSESAGIERDLTTSTWSSERWALHDDVDDEEVANQDEVLDVEENAAMTVTEKLLLRRERDWASKFFVTGVWGTEKDGGAGEFTGGVQWDNQSSSDPEKDIDTGKETVLQTTGKLPNTLAVGYATHKALKQHPNIKEQYKFTTDESINAEMLRRYFEVDNYVICMATYASNTQGATASYSFVQSDNALLAYVDPNPGRRRPTAYAAFGWRGFLPNPYGVFMRRIRMEHKTCTRVEGEMHFVHKVISSDLGYFFLDCVG